MLPRHSVAGTNRGEAPYMYVCVCVCVCVVVGYNYINITHIYLNHSILHHRHNTASQSVLKHQRS